MSGITEVSYRYVGNPAKYCAEETSITLSVSAEEDPAQVLGAARAMVLTSLGLKPSKKDRVAAKRYLTRRYANTCLEDFTPTDT